MWMNESISSNLIRRLVSLIASGKSKKEIRTIQESLVLVMDCYRDGTNATAENMGRIFSIEIEEMIENTPL